MFEVVALRDSFRDEELDEVPLEFKIVVDEDVDDFVLLLVDDEEDLLFLFVCSKLINRVGSNIFSAGSQVLSLSE